MLPILRSHMVVLFLMLPMAWSATAEAHRQYDPGKRRFVQRDPIGYTKELSLVAYLSQTPMNRNDPSGYLTNKCQNGNCDLFCAIYNLGAPPDWQKSRGGRTTCCYSQDPIYGMITCYACTCWGGARNDSTPWGQCAVAHEGLRLTQLNCGGLPSNCSPHNSCCAPNCDRSDIPWLSDCDAYRKLVECLEGKQGVDLIDVEDATCIRDKACDAHQTADDSAETPRPVGCKRP